MGDGIRTDLESGDDTLLFKAHGDAGLALGVAHGSGKADIETAITFDRDRNPKTLSLSGALTGQVKLKIPGLEDLPPEAGRGATFDAQLDLGDNETCQEASAYLRAASRGKVVRRRQAPGRTARPRHSALNTEDPLTAQHTTDLGVVSGGVENSRTETRDVFIRMPGGSFEQYRPPLAE